MKPSARRTVVWAALILLVIFQLPAHGQNVIALVGSGSNLPTPLYNHWIEEYNRISPNIQVRYLSIGTVKGIEDITRGVGDFAAGEVPLSEEQLKNGNRPIVQIPMVLVAIVPIYHVPGVKGNLRFSGAVLADIFLGNIKSWDDAQIKELNAGQALPHLDIAVVHRTEGKGSNYIFSDFLSKVSPKWHSEVGKSPSPEWPVGASANRGEDMLEKVKSTPGAIGYIELGFVQGEAGVDVGLVRNASGKYVSANSSSVAAACQALEKNVPADFRASLTNAPGADAYPIVSFTWLYVLAKGSAPQRSKALANYIEWTLANGQNSALKHGYTPLPTSLTPKVLAKARALE